MKFANAIGSKSLAELRSVSARDLLDASIRNPEGLNGAIVDGWFLPQDIYTTYAQGKQNDVALLPAARTTRAAISVLAPGTLAAAHVAARRRTRLFLTSNGRSGHLVPAPMRF